MTRRTLLRLACSAAFLAACGAVDAPPEPVWGKEPCAHCAMILSDKRFGAQLVTGSGDRFFFDDVGCMVLFIEERPLAPRHAWVRDAATGAWLDARTARFRSGVSSPMDFGFEARADGACPDGDRWDAMRERVLAKQGAR